MEPQHFDPEGLFEHLPGGIFACDKQGVICMANAAMHRLCGHFSPGLIGLHLASLPDHATERHALQLSLSRMHGTGGRRRSYRIGCQ